MAELTNAERNKELLERFAAQFVAVKGMSGSPAVHPTDGVNGQRLPDGYMMAMYDKASAIGVTAMVFGAQHFKAFIEVVQSHNDGVVVATSSAGDFRVVAAGQVLAQALREFGARLHGVVDENGPERSE